MIFVLQRKTNKEKSTEIFPPLLLAHIMYVYVQKSNAESQKSQQKGIFERRLECFVGLSTD